METKDKTIPVSIGKSTEVKCAICGQLMHFVDHPIHLEQYHNVDLQTKWKERFYQEFEKFTKSASGLLEAWENWDGADELVNTIPYNHPFSESFDEVVHKISLWHDWFKEHKDKEVL